MSNIKTRLLQLTENKGISKREFCRQINVSHTYLNGDSEIGSDKLEVIISIFPELSLDWLLTGNGPMLRGSEPAQTSEPTVVYERDPRDIQLIATQEETIQRDKELVAAKDELIAVLKDRIRDFERQGFRTEISGGVPTADYPSPAGTQRHRK